MNSIQKKNPNINTLLAIAIVGCFTIVSIVITPFLSDYSSYESLYVRGGGYLKLYSRDLLFVYLINFFNKYISYNEFRILACFYFYLISIIYILKINRCNNISFYIISIFTYLLIYFTKFDIQFREGIAISIFLLATCYFQNINYKNIFFVLICYITAILIHLGNIYIFTLFILSASNIKYKNLYFFIITIGYSTILLNIFPEYRAINFFAANVVKLDVTIIKYLYWNIYASISIYIYYINSKYIKISPYKDFIKYLSFAVIIMTIYFDFYCFNMDLVTASNFLRVIYFLTYINILYNSFSGRNYLFTILVLIFLYVDVIRVAFYS